MIKFIQVFFIFIFATSLKADAETLAALQEELLRNNPEIAAARNRFLASTKLPVQESALPDPKIAFVDFGVGQPFSTLNQSDFAYRALGFTQEFPFPGKLSLRKKIAEEFVQTAKQDLRATEIRLVSALKRQFAEYFYFQETLVIAERYRGLLDNLNEITEARYRVGKGLQQDVLRAQLERSAIEERLQLLQQDLENERAGLNALLNRDVSQPLKVEADHKPAVWEEAYEALVAQLQSRSPELLTKAHQEQQKKLQLQLAQKGKYPDFEAGFQWQRTGSDFPDYYMSMVQVKLPIYFWRKQRPAIEQATLEWKASQDDAKATRLQLQGELKAAYSTATTTAKLVRLYDEGIIPQSRLSLESATNAYQVGQVDFITLLNNATSLLNYESESLRKLADHRKAVAKIEELTAQPLSEEDQQ
ncbi:MAG TPA: TolC family protein [Acidobacteriota bacterium]|nr:TolC family protein [Acidobacteriota bacterium]